MSSNDDRHGGIPTRAIHEAYLDMQRALKRHRQATDRGDDGERDRAHGDVQETVLTFYELLRPHIKHNDAVSDYWDGKLPSYNGDDPPDAEDGTGVIHTQSRYKPAPLSHNQWEALQESDWKAWHDSLGLNGNVRVVGLADMEQNQDGVVALVAIEAYELGLRRLDSWGTEIVTTQTELGGFLGSETRERRERQRVAMPKLQRAARELSDVAEQLGALSEFDAATPRTEITDELIEEVDEWRKQNIG